MVAGPTECVYFLTWLLWRLGVRMKTRGSLSPGLMFEDMTSSDNSPAAGEGTPERAADTAKSVDVKEQQPSFRLVDAQWLRAQRHAVSNTEDLKEYQQQLTDAVVGFRNSQGNGVGVALAMTVGAVVLAILGVVLGLFIMGIAGDWLSSMGEG